MCINFFFIIVFEGNFDFCFSSAIVNFIKDTVGDITGKCEGFEAVPGCGLRCSISSVESMVNYAAGSEKVINYKNL